MRITQILLGTLAVLGPLAAAQDDVYGDAAAEIGSPEVEIANDAPIVDAHTPDVDAKDASTGAPVDTETFRYESDISRLRNLVIHSLYSHKDVFLRELLSNANDALEKLRITSLTDRGVLSSGDANVTLAIDIDPPKADGTGSKTGKITIRDTGIGMAKAELARNLGTIARSGTNEFLKRAEDGSMSEGNLIGQFGLGFYSAFLVSPNVRVSSLPPATEANPNPVQHTFVSSAKGDTFEVFPDPRGNTLGRGTEIVLEIGEDDQEFLNTHKVRALIEKHSTFATTFPIYLREPKQPGDTSSETDVWTHINDKAPIWMRDPDAVPKEDYIDFYKAVSKETEEPFGWSHFRGDTASGVSYRAIMYIPSSLPNDFWQKIANGVNNVRLMVKRVFITDDLGQDFMPRWLSFLKVTVDADDLPLNVSRETLQSNRFLKQLQRILVRKGLDLFTRLAEDEPEKYKRLASLYGNALRIGMIESLKDKIKIAKLLRFESTRSNYTSLEEYVANRKEGQQQIYYMAGAGQSTDDLARSPFVEKLKARGYEVLLLPLPSDEPMMQALGVFMAMAPQDVAKKGLKYGDEEEDAAEQRELEAQTVAFKPLIEWLKITFKGQVSDVVLTNRLVTSPCTIVVDQHGWSANMARIMAAQAESDNNPMYDMYKNLPRVLEINPRSPLIEGLLSRVLDLPSEPTEEASLDEIELTETARILFDTTLVRSGFNVPDSNEFFDRIEALLRSSLGVRLDARTDTHVRPAPPTAAELPADNTVELETDADIEVEEEAEEDPWAEFEKLGLKVESGDNEDWPSDDDFMDWDAFKNSLGHDEL